MEKKKILFIITQSEFGGAQRFLYNLISRLDSLNYDIKVAVGNTGNNEFTQALRNINISVQELKLLLRGINPIKDMAAVFELRKLIKSFCPDTLFLISSKAGFIGSLATVFTTRIKTSVIYRIGGWSFNDPWPAWKKWLWIILERFSARWKDIIIVNSRLDLELANKFKIKPKEKITLIHNGLDVYKMELLSRDEARLKLFEQISKKLGKIFHVKNIIGTIANLYPSKGLKYLIEAAEHFKNNNEVIFFIIGDGQERNKLEALIEQKGLQNKVLLLGQIPNAYKLLNAFDIFVLPSVKEGFPWAVIEAMTAKLPVIATRVGAVPEIIEDGKNGIIVEPAQPEKIAEKIQDLLSNDRLRQEMGIQAHQTVLFKFELDKMIRQIEELL